MAVQVVDEVRKSQRYTQIEQRRVRLYEVAQHASAAPDSIALLGCHLKVSHADTNRSCRDTRQLKELVGLGSVRGRAAETTRAKVSQGPRCCRSQSLAGGRLLTPARISVSLEVASGGIRY